MLYTFLKYHCICMLKALGRQTNIFKSIFLLSYFELSALTLLTLYFIFQYVSLSRNHSNQKATRIDKIFLQIVCKDDMLLQKQYFLSNGKAISNNLAFSEHS